MNAETELSHSQALVERMRSIADEDIPASACNAAQVLLLDTMACALAGRQAPGIQEVLTSVCDWGGKAEASVLFSDAPRLPMPNAAFANSAIIHALDFDDVYTPGELHLTSVIVPAVWAAGEVANADGRRALAAMVLGIEMAARIGVAERGRRRSGGFLPTALAGGFGAVVAAARLLDLTLDETIHAIGINYAQAAGNRQALLDASLTKRLQPAFAVRSALWGVTLARAGITGPVRIFEGDAGYFKLFMNGDVPDRGEWMASPEGFAVEQVSTKRYPSCGACHAVQIAAERLREEEGLTPDDIERVETFGIPPLVAEPFRLKDNPQVSAQFSGAWAVAHTLLRGPATLADYTDDAVRGDREVIALTQQIKAVAAPEDLPAPPWPVNQYRDKYQGVVVYTRDGRRLLGYHAPCQVFSTRREETSWESAERKFRDCAQFAALGVERADAIVESIKQLSQAAELPDLKSPSREMAKGCSSA